MVKESNEALTLRKDTRRVHEQSYLDYDLIYKGIL